jgi:hypothetical protein
MEFINYVEYDSTVEINTVYNMLWRANVTLIFLVHVSIRQCHHQGEHVNSKVEVI